jgi:TolB protein
MRKFTYSALACLGALAFFITAPDSAIAARLGLFHSQKSIGVNSKKGKAKFDSKKDVYTVTGGGANMWAKTDAFEFVYTKMSGDVTLTADISFVGKGVEEHRKGALMIRQSLDPDSAYADAALHGSGLTSLQYRETAAADTKEAQSSLNMPTRLRIERRGNQFTMYAGTGSDPKPSGPVTVEMEDPVYVGLAVTSHNANVLETVLFSDVKLESGQKQAANRLSVLPLLLTPEAR